MNFKKYLKAFLSEVTLETVKVSMLLDPRSSVAKCELLCVMRDVEALCLPVFPSWCVSCVGGALGHWVTLNSDTLGRGCWWLLRGR